MSKETREERLRREVELELDRQLEGTFPASDALKITRRKPEIPLEHEQGEDGPAS